jgi:chemotaxis response regulator CheB
VSDVIRPTESAPARVLVINDSAVARAVIRAVLSAAPGFRLSGEAATGLDGVAQAASLRPDLVLLDMHLPDINGVEVTRRILSVRRMRILICTATVHRNMGYLFDALKAGALDYTQTPKLNARPGERIGRDALAEAGKALVAKMRTVLGLALEGDGAAGSARSSQHPDGESSPIRDDAAAATHLRSVRIVGVGCSTGGPGALARLLGALPKHLAAPVLVSQHIEEPFTSGLADWLSRESDIPVEVAKAGQRPESGHVYLARGGRHNLLLRPGWHLDYESSGSSVYYPNINRMLASIAEVAGGSACGVVLTGLGDDGAIGMAQLAGVGARLLVQDPATAVVDGMPGAVIRAGSVDRGYSLEQLGQLIGGWAAAR